MADLSTTTNDAQSVQTTESLITNNIDIWTTAIEQKSSAGRGTASATGKRAKFSLYGIKKLRELILELAVRGKLVPQDVNEEPASVLLERIVAEKAQLVKEGKLKKQKPLPDISDDEKPFELPNGWEWSRLQDVIQISSGKNLTSRKMVQDGDVPVYGGNGITGYHDTYNVSSSTLVIGRVGFYCGSVHITPDSAWVTDNAFITRFDEESLFIEFLYWLFKNTDLSKNDSATAQPVISGSKVYPIVVAIPPTEEQHRIVAKVDELMSLCDALEAQTEASIAAHQTLVETLLNALRLPNATQPVDSQSASPEPSFADSLEPVINDSFIDSWQRIAEHFDTLFTTAASIDTLKQTILQLAVMGKLVPQASCEARHSPDYEPAAKLLARIAAEKAQLIKDGKIKKEKPLPSITDEEKPFELPGGWEWCRLGTLYSFLNGFAFKSEWFQPDGIKLLRNINIAHSETKWGDQACIPSSMAAEYEKYRLSAGDIVISLDRPIINTGLKYAVIEQSDLPCLLLQRVAKFHSYADTVTPKYLSRWLESDLFMSAIDPGRSNGVPHISTKQLEAMVFPLCSLEEQHRIVARVDELMALCDQLKARLTDAQTTQLHLTDAIVEQAL